MSGQGGGKSRWGSLLSQAVAGVEARLDTILAEEDQPKSTQSPSASPKPKSSAAPSRSDSTRSKPNDRLQERLARAVAAKQAAARGEASSVKLTPTTSPRQSLDVPNRTSTDSVRPALSAQQSLKADPSPRASQDSDSERKSTEAVHQGMRDAENTPRATLDTPVPEASNGVAAETTNGSAGALSPAGAVTELQEDRIKQLEKALEDLAMQQQEETHNYVEQIDALQAKLQYLAREASDSARKAAQEAPAGSLERKLAEKDQQIAGLMEEGKNLASTEQKLRTFIKNLRSKVGDNEKEMNNIRTSKGKVEQELEAMRRTVRRADEIEKYQEELHKRIGQSQKEIDALKSEGLSKERIIADLKAQLQKAAEDKETLATKVNEEALAKERKRVRELEEQVSDLKVEKDLAVDRGRARENELQEKAERAAERARVVEVELKAEIQAMESKMESMRVLAEEVSSGALGDSQAKLLRQVETLQTQHAIASENWQGIESTLLSRIANLEKERDEAQHRESEMRKKAREAALRAKRLEEELEQAKTQLPTIQETVKLYKAQTETLKTRAEKAEAAVASAKVELEQLKSAWAEEKSAKEQDRPGQWIDDAPTQSYRGSSRPESPAISMPVRSYSTELLGIGSISSKFRKHSAPSSNGDPMERYVSRRTSIQPPSRPPLHTGNSNPLPPILSPTVEALPATPSIHPLERQDMFDSADLSSSPQQIIQDMVSVSTVAAGPSVQLVEKLSAAIRRLETEKVAAKEELTRISSQRDEARAEMVALMREVEKGKKAAQEVARLRAEVAEVNGRYETTLELLGEKSEAVEELKADVEDVKAMYRDLVERTIK